MIPRDMAQLTPAERMRRDIQRYISEEAGIVSKMMVRNRRVRAARDEEENEDAEVPEYWED